MSILITGKGTSGSWQCRGVQLGGEVGNVRPNASLAECKAADLIVVVKRINAPFFDAIRRSGRPWIWDLVDFYPQPACSTWNREQAIEWVRRHIDKAKPNGIIWPNRRMMDDCGDYGTVIYHHARDLPKNPIREQVQTVGYEGSERYLGMWRPVIEKECKRRGWKFRTGITADQVDIVVALRDQPHNGYVQQHWKSNVKLANAHGTGTPFIGQRESAYDETKTGYECFISRPDQLGYAFDELTPWETRMAIAENFLAERISLESVAEQLRDYAKSIVVQI